jgi:hypothetical protein
MDNYGFIITRHVNSEKTNEYWNNSVKCLKMFYPNKKIIIIDDNSNYDYVKSDYEYKNVIIIQSEYPGRGELLPYYYFYKNKFFQNAVILHDSVFIHKRIHFEKMVDIDVLPFWHFNPDNENYINSLYLSSKLNNNYQINQYLTNNSVKILGAQNEWHGCFGAQSYINYSFLNHIVNKYALFNLLDVVKCRMDRCCLERIIGILFSKEKKNKNIISLLGNIHSYQNFSYTFDNYKNDFYIKKKIPKLVVKVWTGR